MDDFRQALAALGSRADAIARKLVDRWDRSAEQELGQKLPAGLDLDSLPELIRALAAAAPVGPEDPAAVEMIRIALEHGKDRRHAGYADGVIFREYHLLRRFLWDELKQVGASQQAIVGAILHIDTAMTAATSGSIHGYYLIDRPTDEDELVRKPTRGPG